MECYNEMDKRPPQATCVHKVAMLPQKTGHWKVDDTDSSSDEEDLRPVTNSANLSMEEWKLYLNTHEDVPDDSCLFSATGNAPKKATSQNGSHATELTV